MNRSETIGKISAALVKAQSEMGAATKDAKNPFFKSSYADLTSVREAVIPVLNKHGITVLQLMTVVDGKQFIETTALHESGEFIASLTEIVVSKQNDPQAAGSGQSYARRYGLQAFFCVGAEDDDGEKAMGRTTANKPVVTANKAEDKKAEQADTPVQKKGGFGVKKEQPKVEETTASSDEWS